MARNLKEQIYLKGKESFVVGTLLMALTIIFIIPLTIFFIIRYIYKLVFNDKKEKTSNFVSSSASINISQQTYQNK